MKWIYLGLFLCLTGLVTAEGTKELAPNANIIVEGRNSPDITALHIGHTTYANFAYFDDPNPDARLYVKVLDPNTECLMLGFSSGQENDATPVTYRFYVKDPDGNVVYRSDQIRNNTAQIDNWEEAVSGPQALVGANGYNQVTITSAELTQFGWMTEGDYYIEFDFRRSQFTRGLIIPLWDISVVDCMASPNQTKPGRIWSQQWSLYTPAVISDNFARPFNGSFFIVAPDDKDPGAGFVTKMDFNGSGFRAAAFTVALNSFGADNAGTLQTNRRSIFDDNSIIGEYPVYLNDPVDIYRTAELGALQILGTEGCLPDNYCFRAVSSEIGEIEILIDLDGQDGIYTPNSKDVLVNYKVEAAQVDQEFCIPWDGFDGLGVEYEGVDFDSFTVITAFRQGIYHFPVFDVEINTNGFRLEAVRPLGLDPKLYYDDTNIPFNSGTGSPIRNLIGCETPCHTWQGSTFGAAYGNDNTINSWWYARTLIDEAKVILKFNKTLDTDVSFCDGDFVQVGDSLINQEGLHVFSFGTAAGCDSVVTIAAHRVDFSSVIDVNSNELNCYFPNVELNGTFSRPFNGISFQWAVPDSQDMSNLLSPIIDINKPGIYQLIITENTVGCSDTTEIEITENFIIPEIEMKSEIALSCDATDHQLNAAVNEADNYLVAWSTIDGNIVSGGDGLDPVINQLGTYSVSAQNSDNGCVSSREVLVLRDTSTYLTIQGGDEISAAFCEAASLNISLNSNAYRSVQWSPAESLICPECLVPDLFVDKDETFYVVVTDTNGCTAQKQVDVFVDEDFRLYIPNAFSPNNDGINDKFDVYSATCAVDVLSFQIFNRWGNRVFERSNFQSTDLNVGWDGRYKDKAMETGVYIYQVSIKTFRDETVQLQGELELIR